VSKYLKYIFYYYIARLIDIYSLYVYYIHMRSQLRTSKYPRRPVTLTIADDVLQEAKALKLNTSQAAEAGIREALRKVQAEAWLAEHATGIAAYNAEVKEHGLPLKPLWVRS
jgi:antitoxin CcdA